MLFTHDTDLMLQCAAALVNTAPSPVSDEPERLVDPGDLKSFFRDWDFTGALVGTDAELVEVRAMRARLRAAWQLDTDALVAEVNLLLREGQALPQLVNHGDLGWHVHATRADQPFAVRIGVEFAVAAIDVIRADGINRLRVCEADACEDVLVDLSKNRSKRFCSTTCGNRENVAAYRARQRAGD